MASVSLQSKDHRVLLDIIDNLRSHGISRYIDLPEIVVCGDQSSGKSSVLEAISGMSFPTKDNLCTRFATELVLRRDKAVKVKVSITPGPERSFHERERLLLWKPTETIDEKGEGLDLVIENAKEIMGLSETKRFSTDILKVELSGPTQPHLTMVDLPGIFRAGNREQSVDDAATVKRMVKGHMRRPRSIILAVVSAKSDFALQEITEIARALDPTGSRTLGLITKPDTLDAGSDSELSYLKLAQNKDIVFRLGWHVLKNRNYEMRKATSEERNNTEEEFLSKGVWASLDPSHRGVRSLQPRLSNVLKDQILLQMPSLLEDVERGILDCQNKIEKLGTPRSTLSEQRRYVLRISQDFSTIMKAATDGIYSHPFFGSAKTEEGYHKRLRAVVQKRLTEFVEQMDEEGEARFIVESRADAMGKPTTISRDAYIEEVKELMQRSRGCELPGIFNPLIIGELFLEQSQPWKDIANDLKSDVINAVYRTVRGILDYVTVEETSDAIYEIINTGIEELKTDLDKKVVELLNPHHNGHPITYNNYLTDNVQKAQAERRKAALENVFRQFASIDLSPNKKWVDTTKILDALIKETEANMERYASSLAVDYMQAYYKVRVRSF